MSPACKPTPGLQQMPHPGGLTNAEVLGYAGGGATILKVGGQILRAERAENFFLTPHFLASGGDKIFIITDGGFTH